MNVDFQVLLCIHPTCHRAVSPSSLSQHLRRKHRAPLKLRQQVDSYVGQFLQISANYDFRTVPLPLGGGLPLPILPVINGYQCQHCCFKTQNRSNIRKHGNQKHGQKRATDKEIYREVQLQTWFAEGKERYWVVDASGESRDVNNGQGSGSGSDDEESRDAGAAIKAEIEE